MIPALTVAALVLPLALDTFVLAAALGAAGLAGRDRLRLSLVLSAFEGGMPVLGFLLGAALANAAGGLADYAGALVLVLVGVWFLWPRADGDEERQARRLRSARGFGLLALGLSISLDELAIGFGGGLLRLPLALLVVLIAAQAFLAAQAGLWLGARLAAESREWAERGAGLLLLAAALLVLVERFVS
ncbi:MAG TPA: manganese efflux pump [Candidatus Acidoferrales bacterium]|nr:manganese efflux pump [Candidatus Acidoferrales bacterium]